MFSGSRVPRAHRNQWSVEQLEMLQTAGEHGVHPKDLAQLLGRTEEAVGRRLLIMKA
jgi:hypothetical protein